MAASTVRELERLIAELAQERQQHQAAIEEIDSTFESLGISVGVVVGPAKRGRKPSRRGRKPGRPAGKRGPGRPKGSTNQPTAPAKRGRKPKAAKKAAKKAKRRTFSVPGNQAILNFVKEAGAKGRTSGEIDKNWASEGRSGHAYITLGQLVREKKLNKKPIKDGKGSVYTAV